MVLFLGWGLSTERVVAQPLHLFLFPPGMEVPVLMKPITTCACLYRVAKIAYVF